MIRDLIDAEQLAFDVPLPERVPAPCRPQTYWENRGPRDWRPVLVTVRYGDTRGLPDPPFPHVRTKPLAPRNVTITRPHGVRHVVPVRTLRRQQPK